MTPQSWLRYEWGISPMRTRLFDFVKNPFALQFDGDFMRLVPELPGVYKMRDDRGDIVYVGKAKNLRARLMSYRHLDRSSEVSRKNLRLLQSVRSIDWEILPSETDAFIRESHLIRKLKPMFNVLRPEPEVYAIVLLTENRKAGNLSLAWERSTILTEGPMREGQWFGAFRGRWFTARALRSLERLQWLARERPTQALDYPSALRNDRSPPSVLIRWSADQAASLRTFFSGSNRKLILNLKKPLLTLSRFWRTVAEREWEALDDYWQRGPRRNRLMLKKGFAKRLTEAQPYLIDPQTLDESIFEFEGSKHSGHSK